MATGYRVLYRKRKSKNILYLNNKSIKRAINFAKNVKSRFGGKVIITKITKHKNEKIQLRRGDLYTTNSVPILRIGTNGELIKI